MAEHRLAVRRLAEGGKRREKGAFTDGDSRFQVLSEDGERLLSPVLTTAHASYTYVWTRAGMPTQRIVREARDTP